MHCKSYSHFFSKKVQHICVSLDVNFNETLTNDVISFEQLGPGVACLNSSSATFITFMESDHEIISVHVWSVSPFQGFKKSSKLLSITGKSMGLSLPRKSVNRLTDQLNMTLTLLTGP